MEKKRLTKYVWWGADVDKNGNPILPGAASADNHLDGLNVGEIFIHVASGSATLWTATPDGKIVQLSGADIDNLYELFLSKQKDDKTPFSLGVGKSLSVGESVKVGDFVEGTLGSGASTFMRDGSSYSEVDFLKVRKKATFTEITVQELKHVGGEIILSPAAMICSRVEESENGWKCYFNTEDSEGRKVYQEFEPNDLARCQTFNLSPKGANDLTGNHYYWRKVVSVGDDYIELSKAECDAQSDAPQVGDNISQLGNTSNTERQAAIILSAFGSGAPSYKQYNGIDGFSLVGKQVTKLSPYGNELTGILNIEAGSKGAGNLEDFPEEIFKAVHIGSVNLLLNSGFTGDYKSEDLDASYALSDKSELFSRGMKHWTGTATINDDAASVSGKSATIGSLSQSVQLMKNEGYVVSFKAKGASVKVILGGASVENELTSEYMSYSFKFTSDGIGTFSISGDATICDLQLERGTIETDWHPSPYDNDKALADFQALKYIQDAIQEGDTTILGGLILSSMIQLGNYKDGKMEKVNAGMSGIYNDDDDVAFWGGGTFEQAIRTIIKFKQNPNYSPTTSEWADMANFVVSHGGDLFLRGYIHALGGYFRGEINAEKGVFKNVKSPNNSFVIDDEGNVKIVGTFETSVQGRRIVIDANNQNIVLYDELGRETAKMNFYDDVGESWTYGTVALKRYQQSSLNVAMECFISASQMDIIDYITKYKSHYRAGFMQVISIDGQNAEISIGLNKSFTSATEYNWKSNVQFGNLPTSASEVGTGGIYNDNGTLKVKQ